MVTDGCSETIRLGISTCPNDTFAFFPILENRIDTEGIDFQVQLLDVQQLNEGLFAGQFDVAKASFHAAVLLADEFCIFKAGSAVGFGNGPLLLSANEGSTPETWSDKDVRRTGRDVPLVLCPGEHTTANMLYRCFYPESGRIENVVFSEIMPRLQKGDADFGVCIHEGRFTFRESGLGLVEDLGERWERELKSPLPLGGILGRRSLGDEMLQKISKVIQKSVRYALDHRSEAMGQMKKFAVELEEAVIWSHVDLYVNRWTLDLNDGWDGNAIESDGNQAQNIGDLGGQREFTGAESLVGLAKIAVEKRIIKKEVDIRIV